MTTTFYSKLFLSAAVVGLSAGAAMPAFAQEQGQREDKVEVDQVITTAQRREQSLQDASVAVTAFSGDFLEAAKIDNSNDLVGYVPGLHLAPFSRVQALPALRGAQSGEDGPGLDQPVAFFIDDVYKGRVTDWDMALFDVERVEVLRGPQGTLFGRNVVGGLINVVTRKPTEENRAIIEASTGRFNLIDVKGVVSGPLSEENGLYGSVAFSTKSRDGFTTNTFNGAELDAVDKTSAKAQLRYAPGGAFEALLQGDFTKDNGFGQHRDYVGPQPDAPSLAGFVPDTNPNTVNIQSDGGVDRTAWGASLALDYNFGSSQLKSITAFYSDQAELPETDAFGLPVPIFFTSQDYELDQFSQEIRLSGSDAFGGRLEWVVGGFYLNIDHTRNRRFNADLIEDTFLGDIQVNFVPGDTSSQFFESLQTVETNSISGFFQGTYSLTDSFRLTVGGRYTHDTKEGTLQHIGNSFLFNDAGEFDILLPKASFNAFTPKLTVEYDFTDDIMGYATYSEGFKAGGFTVDGLDDPAFFQVPINPEKAENFEIGVRSSWFDNRFVANLTAYKVNYTDLQVSQLITTGGVVQFLQTTAGAAEAEGLEVELIAAVARGFDVWANYAYFNGEYTDFGGFTGNQMVSPPHAFSAGFSYEHQLENDHSIGFRADIQHKDEYFQDPANEPGIVNGIDGIINASVSWNLPSNWEFELWVKNLTDERAVNYANDSSVFILSTAQVQAGEQAFAYNYVPPMTWGITGRFEY